MSALARGAGNAALLDHIAVLGPEAIWLLDVDDTLIDTIRMHGAAAEAVAASLRSSCSGEMAGAVAERFNSIFQVLARHRQTRPRDPQSAAQYRDLQLRVEQCQAEIHARWGVMKPFSREVLLRLAAEDCGLALNALTINEAADAYWQHLQANTIWFEDALQLVQKLSLHDLPIYLMTSSDARFTPSDATPQFSYDPDQSRRFKAQRLSALRAAGLKYNAATIGDPIDKPSREFFDRVFAQIDDGVGSKADRSRIIVVGDSYRADLEVPVADGGCGLGLLYVRGQEGLELESPNIVSLGDLRQVSVLMKDAS